MYTVNGYAKYLQNFLVKETQLSWSRKWIFGV